MISKQDWKFVPVNPDPGFDPVHNKRVVEETIRKSQLLMARKKREHTEKVRERTSAVASYLSSLNTGKTSSSAQKYFGRHEIARLRGEEILGIVRGKIGDATKKKIRETAKLSAQKL